MVLTTPRLWASSHMDHSLKRWTQWSLWVPSKSEYSLILVLQTISTKRRSSLQVIATVLPVNTPIPQQIPVCLVEIRQNPLLPHVLCHGQHMKHIEHTSHYEDYIPHSTSTANPSRTTHPSFASCKTISLPSILQGPNRPCSPSH